MRLRPSLPLLLMVAVVSLSQAAEPPDPPLPSLRSGVDPTSDLPQPLEARVLSRFLDAHDQLLEVALSEEVDSKTEIGFDNTPRPFAFVSDGRNAKPSTIWIRRAASQASAPLAGHVYIPSANHRDPARHGRFIINSAGGTNDLAVRDRFANAAASFFEERRSGAPFYAFAAAKMRARLSKKPLGDNGRPLRPTVGSSEMARLMETTTGAASIQEALQTDRPLWLSAASGKATLPIASLTAPKLADHPFTAMLKLLDAKVPSEPLAQAAPADFYYVRLADLSVLFKLIDQLDAWGTPIANVVDSQGEDRGLAERYLTQLGLNRGPLARALGTQVVAELAVVGSDPYLREGSDITIIFRVKARALFDAAVGGTTSGHAEAHGGAVTVDTNVDGVTVHGTASRDGALRQERASVGDFEIVSNSLPAMRRVLATLAGGSPRLADEPDFRFLLARDAGTRADAFAFLGDRFVASVVGPRQKILEARRQMALAALSRPGYAAMLYGWLEGKSPKSTDELIAAGLLDKSDFATPDGAKIAFDPGQPVRSPWGSPQALTPLIEWPSPTVVSAAEKDGYDFFANAYQMHWRQYIDPIALRIAIGPGEKGETRLTADLRVLPLIEGSDYHKLSRTAGDARVLAPELAGGWRTVIGVGPNATLRRDLSQNVNGAFGNRFQIDWLGDWALLGVEDRSTVAEAFLAMSRHEMPEPPPTAEEPRYKDDKLEKAVRLPLYFGLGIRAVAGAALFLTGARKLVTDAAPGVVEWREWSVHKSAHIVRIAVAPKSVSSDAPGVSIFYTLTNDAFYASLSESLLYRILDGKPMAAPATPKSGSQMIMDWVAKKDGALSRVLGWLMESEILRDGWAARVRAEAVLRGNPESSGDPAALRRLALAYDGAVPLPPDGGSFTLGPDGVRDPARGSRYALRWPKMPVEGSPVARLLLAVSRFRGELSFDEEVTPAGAVRNSEDSHEKMRSLHARVTLGLR